jgi:hypothetical protein
VSKRVAGHTCPDRGEREREKESKREREKRRREREKDHAKKSHSLFEQEKLRVVLSSLSVISLFSSISSLL